MKIKVYDNAEVTFEKLLPSGMYLVQLRINGEVSDKVRCDDYKMALEYRRAFCSIAKGA